MEILFLWVSKYGSIEEQGFNLGGEIKFTYENKDLSLEKNEDYIKGFFNKDSIGDIAYISNVTAVVGANGAGKSTFLDFIKNNLPFGIGGIHTPCIVAIKAEGGKRTIYHHESIQITSGNYKEHDFMLEPFKSDELTKYIIRNTEIPSLSNTSFIHFSNIFDNKPEQSIGDLHNISTNYLIRGDKKKLIEDGTYNYSESETKAFQHREVNRQLQFIKENFNKNWVPFKLPEFLSISPIYFELNRGKYKKYGPLVEQIYIEIEEYHKENIGSNMESLDVWKEEFRRKFYSALILNFFYELENNMYIEVELKGLNIINKIKHIKDIEGKTVYEKIKNIFQPIIKKDDPESDLNKGTSIQAFIDYIEDLVEEGDVTYLQQLNMKTTSQNNELEIFWDLYRKTYSYSQYLQFNWSGLSSGQQALFNIFARFYSLADYHKISTGNELKDNIFVLIDEGELYFHPQWQKQLLNILLDYLPRVLSSKRVKRNIQIIMTSNSPFILSDLPTSNVIFLKNYQGATIVSNEKNQLSKTFGANIYSLYADSFFIQEGLIGDFVKKKINNVTKLLLEGNHEELIEQEEEIKKTISIIAEPVIHNKLLSLYKGKFVTEKHDRESEIFYLEKRLKALRKMNDNDKN